MGRFTGLQADKLNMPNRKTKRTNKLTGLHTDKLMDMPDRKTKRTNKTNRTNRTNKTNKTNKTLYIN